MKDNKKKDWYKEDACVFIPATPDSCLSKHYKRVIREVGLSIRVVEVAGPQLKRKLQKSDPFKKKKCERPDCLICPTGSLLSMTKIINIFMVMQFKVRSNARHCEQKHYRANACVLASMRPLQFQSFSERLFFNSRSYTKNIIDFFILINQKLKH